MLFLGVDGGQSSTTALIADETGTVIGRGAGGPCNHAGAFEGPAKLKRAVMDCVGKACTSAGLNGGTVHFEVACFGMSGGPADKRSLLLEILQTNLLVVTNDASIALSGALGGKPGVVTIAGTGSIAFGRTSEGRQARAGGWGYLFGDEGGAFHIVREALRAAVRFEEGWGPKTSLKSELLSATGYTDANALLHAFYTVDWPRARIAALAPLVSRAAGEGDPIALLIIKGAGAELASLAKAVRGRLWEARDPVVYSYIGGVFRNELLLECYRSALECEGSSVVTAPLLGAPAGALLEAYRAAHIAPNIDKLISSSFVHG